MQESGKVLTHLLNKRSALPVKPANEAPDFQPVK
jgi:hypothetical protein